MGISKGNSIAIILFSLIILQYSTTTTFVCAQAPNEPKPFPFSDFEESDHPSFHFSGSSSIDLSALQLTPDTTNPDFEREVLNKSGRIFYDRPYRLWLEENDVVASFNTSFSINIHKEEDWEIGEGFAFLISPRYDTPVNSFGQWLGLTNQTTDGKPENHMVAIEFDTKKQGFDPDANHIGLNINSIESNKTVSLNDFNISLDKGTNFSIWIQYHGDSKTLEVYMDRYDPPFESMKMPDEPVLKEQIDLKRYVKEESYFGFSASTGDPAKQLNCVLRWDYLNVDYLERKKDMTWLKIVIGVGVPVVVLLALLGVMLGLGYMKKRKRVRDEESIMLGTLRRLPGIPREFSYKDLKRATNNFDECMKLGQGGFGVVYRGILHEKDSENGGASSSNATMTTEIAVKRFSRENVKGKDDFFAELAIIHRLRFKHLVRLLGWSHEKGKLLLVYEFMPNGSLEKHLYDSSNPTTLHWTHRYKILTGVASALHYLHNGYDQKVVHRDLKPSNILLDSDYNARLGDFGLARVLENERNSYADLEAGVVPGTLGYVAPECFHTGKATPESDVYGFGAVVLEVVSGQTPGVRIQHDQLQYSLVDWVWMLHREGRILEAVDKRLQKDYDFDEAKRLLLLGLACSHPIAGERPKTPAIYQIILGTLPPPRVPPFKPAFTWPSMASTFSSSDTTFSSITLSSS